MSAPAPIEAAFGRSADGYLAAKVEDLAWLALPLGAGLRIVSAWRLTAPTTAWTTADLYSVEAQVADEAGFRLHVETIAEHRRQVRALDRRALRGSISTPWGRSQSCLSCAEGVTCHSTASHGGFHLDDARNQCVHPLLRNSGGWYEEDGEWAKVALTFPALFTDREREAAARQLRDIEPDAWEAIHGVVLEPGESRVKDERRFRLEHAQDWIVVSALRSTIHPGHVECAATRGGERTALPRRHFLVPAGDYATARFGFVIDQRRHPPLESLEGGPG
jgi:hypothetical protein